MEVGLAVHSAAHPSAAESSFAGSNRHARKDQGRDQPAHRQQRQPSACPRMASGQRKCGSTNDGLLENFMALPFSLARTARKPACRASSIRCWTARSARRDRHEQPPSTCDGRKPRQPHGRRLALPGGSPVAHRSRIGLRPSAAPSREIRTETTGDSRRGGRASPTGGQPDRLLCAVSAKSRPAQWRSPPGPSRNAQQRRDGSRVCGNVVRGESHECQPSLTHRLAAANRSANRSARMPASARRRSIRASTI